MDSPHKGPVLREVFPWHCVVVVYPYLHIALIVATSWNVCQSIVHLLWRHDNIDLTWISQPLWLHLENVSISHRYLHIATIIMTSWFCRPYQVHIGVIVNSPGDALTSLENHISTLASGRLKLPTTRLFFFVCFVLLFVSYMLQQGKHKSFVSLVLRDGNQLVTDGIPSQRASNT